MVGCGIYIYPTRHSLALKANSNSLPSGPGPSYSPHVPDSPLQAALTRGLINKRTELQFKRLWPDWQVAWRVSCSEGWGTRFKDHPPSHRGQINQTGVEWDLGVALFCISWLVYLITHCIQDWKFLCSHPAWSLSFLFTLGVAASHLKILFEIVSLPATLSFTLFLHH